MEALAPNGGLADGVFDELMSPQEAALRLRKDLWVYAQLCRAAESHLRAEDVPAAERVLDALKGFLGYFHDGSYQLLRYGDYDAFDRFTSLLVELPWPPEGPGIRARLGEDLRRFIQTLESTFHSVSRRTHLQGRGFDRQDAEALRDRFLTPPHADTAPSWCYWPPRMTALVWEELSRWVFASLSSLRYGRARVAWKTRVGDEGRARGCQGRG